MNVSEILNKLKNLKRTDKGWTARCPAHDDKHNSLSIRESEDGKPLLHCFAGCSFEKIITALNINKESRRIVRTYDYEDENGQLLYQVCRTEPKGFFIRHPDNEGGFINGLGGVRRVLYRLTELLEANPAHIVIICEGEKDCDRLAELDLIATTNVGGASKWRDEYNEHLRGRPIIILPDNDAPGNKHAAHVAKVISGMAASVKVISLPGLPDKGDVSDYLDAGGTVEDLLQLVENAPLLSSILEDLAVARVERERADAELNSILSELRFN
jgi:putative DNA primase/helicase